jgi:hypothetical protein
MISTITAFALRQKKKSKSAGIVSNTSLFRNTNIQVHEEDSRSGRLTENCVM